MAVYQYRNRFWGYDFWVNGVRQRKFGFPTKQKAREAETDARRNLNKIDMAFITMCESRLDELKLKRTKQHYQENHRLIKNLILLWGGKKEILRRDVEDFLAAKTGTIANRDLRFIKALFNHGLEHDQIGYNPAAKIKPRPVTKRRKVIPPQADIKKVLNQSTPRQRLYLLAVINTMARIREINRLKWEDVHEDYLILRTRKAKNSDLTERAIPLNEALRAVLQQTPRLGEYVFGYKTGKPYGYRSKMLRRLCEKAEVKPFTYHALRHYGASTLANAGVPLPTIQKLLGHQRTTTTDLYLQSIGEEEKAAVQKLSPQFSPQQPEGKDA